MRTLMAAALLIVTACNDPADDKSATETDEPTRAERIADLTGDATAGASVYSDNCALCHAADGSGTSGPNIQDPSAYNQDDLITTVLDGQGTMPSFDALEDQEIADVIAYVLSGVGS